MDRDHLFLCSEIKALGGRNPNVHVRSGMPRVEFDFQGEHKVIRLAGTTGRAAANRTLAKIKEQLNIPIPPKEEEVEMQTPLNPILIPTKGPTEVTAPEEPRILSPVPPPQKITGACKASFYISNQTLNIRFSLIDSDQIKVYLGKRYVARQITNTSWDLIPSSSSGTKVTKDGTNRILKPYLPPLLKEYPEGFSTTNAQYEYQDNGTIRVTLTEPPAPALGKSPIKKEPITKPAESTSKATPLTLNENGEILEAQLIALARKDLSNHNGTVSAILHALQFIERETGFRTIHDKDDKLVIQHIIK